MFIFEFVHIFGNGFGCTKNIVCNLCVEYLLYHKIMGQYSHSWKNTYKKYLHTYINKCFTWFS